MWFICYPDAVSKLVLRKKKSNHELPPSLPCFYFSFSVCGIPSDISTFILFTFLKIFLFMRDTEKEAETQAEGEAGSTQGARHGTRSPVSRIRPRAEGDAKPLSHPGCPTLEFLTDWCPLSLQHLNNHKAASQPYRRSPWWFTSLCSRGQLWLPVICLSVSLVLEAVVYLVSSPLLWIQGINSCWFFSRFSFYLLGWSGGFQGPYLQELGTLFSLFGSPAPTWNPFSLFPLLRIFCSQLSSVLTPSSSSGVILSHKGSSGDTS